MMGRIIHSFVIMSIMIGFVASASKSVSYEEQAATALTKCVKELNLDEKTILSILSPYQRLPEDNPQFTKFFACYWKELNIIDDKGELDESRFIAVLKYLLEKKFGAKIKGKTGEIIKSALDNCRNTPKHDTIGLTYIVFRNCVYDEVHKMASTYAK